MQILKQDEARVNLIHSHLNDSNRNYRILDPLAQSDATVIPAQSASVLGSGNYIVSVGLGSPQKQLSLVFDTGSSLTWTQCRPSSGVPNGCSASTCVYGHQYGDRSFTIGFFASEKLTLTSTDVFTGFVFGCGQNNQGLFRGIVGLLGLGRSKISFVEQTAQKYNRFFPYCLPSTSSSTSYLSLGNSDNRRSGNAVKFTPLTTLSQGASYYSLGLVGINIGGSQLPISASVFSTSGTIIDSGTAITRLPATAYTALRDAFREAMKRYPTAKSISSLLDTCYDFSGFKTITFPTIGFVFGNGVTVDVDATGIVVPQSDSQFCLAFAGNKDDRNVGIMGNAQQKRLQVVYDVAGGKVGFAPAGCQ
ncbi:hypothetical protein C1H46_003235 [Malus baccata]|uniref:Peptidase A1 domain-containing protein n=1 Tax=Malus baccata TaxID=106549 RepID=A0A540NJM5_MALBA|nr:hypothetical protein C1H46_003235 [Malus baccata]